MIEAPSINPATAALLVELQGLARKLDAIRETLERREQRSPGMFKLTAAAQMISLRFRVEWLVLAVSAAGTFGLRVGTGDVFSVEFGAADTKVIPLPVTIDSGKEVSISGNAGDVVDSFILGFTDFEKE